MFWKTFRGSFALTAIGLVLAYVYGGWAALGVVVILGILEVSLSFDNAVLNATVLEKMNDFWQKLFLSVGIFIAVFGMRLVFPLLIVGVTAGLNPAEAFSLAMEGGSPETPGTYAYEMHHAHPAIAAFGGMFLLMIFLDFVFDVDQERELNWLNWLEAPLAKVGRLEAVSVVTALGLLVIAAQTFAKEHAGTILIAGIAGLITYLVVSALGKLFEGESEDEDESVARAAGGVIVKQAGRAAFMSFLYLEVLDASMSFDGVIGAFAVTVDPIIIALGLGVIGAPYVRSLTVYLVRKGTLKDLVYLEHGAHWAIGALAVALLVSIKVHVPEYITGLVGVAFILAALASSHVRNRRTADSEPVEQDATERELETV